MPIINTVIAGGGSPAPVQSVGIPRDVVNGVFTWPQTDYDFKMPDDAITVDSNGLLTAGPLYGALSGGGSGYGPTSATFGNNTYLKKFDFNNVKTILEFGAAYVCYGNPSLTTLLAPNLETIKKNGLEAAFDNTGVVTVTFDKLSSVEQAGLRRAFEFCSNLTDLYFPAITTNSFVNANNNPMSNMVRYCSGVTLHFPSNVQAVVEALNGYSATAPFGATSGTVLFDLPATE